MHIHLYTTDVSALELPLSQVGHTLSAIVIPANRASSTKALALRARSSVPVLVQRRGACLPPDAPPADGAVVWLYSQLFPAALIRSYRIGMLNMHGGKIPQYRGASVLQWAIVNGEATLGVTWHQIVEEVDAGPIWAEGEVPIHPDDSGWTVRERMIEKGLGLFPVACAAMSTSGQPVRIPDLANGRIWPQRKDADGLLEPGLPERRVRDLIRALCPPWPGATVATVDGLRRIVGIGGAGHSDTHPYVTAEGRELLLSLAPRS